MSTVVALILLMLPVGSIEKPSDADTVAVSTRPRLVVLPILFSSPDTRWAAGVLPQVTFHLPGATRPSSARVDAFYTQNSQFTVRVRPTLWFANDSYSAGLNAAWKRWPTTFYGVGSPAENAQKEGYTEHLLEANTHVVRRVATSVYAGLQYDVRYSRLSDLDPAGRLTTGEITGSGSGMTSSLGVVARYDTRDHDFFPTSGGWYQVVARAAGPALGSDYSFSSVEMDLRRYASISTRQTVAVQMLVRMTAGDAPFQAVPAVGSVFRGYETSRFIDSNLLAVQAEYRFVPVISRVGFVGFAGLGQTTRRLSDIGTSDLKYVVGGGLRVQISRQDRVNLRWDYGIGLDSAGDYLDLGEAF
jgi:outer membrane protein assembly factor BamA